MLQRKALHYVVSSCLEAHGEWAVARVLGTNGREFPKFCEVTVGRRVPCLGVTQTRDVFSKVDRSFENSDWSQQELLILPIRTHVIVTLLEYHRTRRKCCSQLSF